MTTASWSTVLDQSTDAGFRAWGSELNSRFASVGMIQTADTGQIDWSTVNRAAALSIAGYEVWKTSSGSLFLLVQYGSFSNQTIPLLQLQVGTGSDGAGNLTGVVGTNANICANASVGSNITNYQSYLCATADYVGLSWKLGSTGGTAVQPRTAFALARTVDSTGAATTVGFLLAGLSNAGGFSQAVAVAANVIGPQIGPGSGMNCFWIPSTNTATNPTSSQDGSGNNQAFLMWFCILGATPMIPMLHMAMVFTADLAVGVTASMTLVGTTAHTYLNCGSGAFMIDPADVVNVNTNGFAILWE